MNPQRKNAKERWKAEEARVRAILLEWNPLRAPVPLDEYDCLVHRVLTLRGRGGSPDQVRELLVTNLTEHFGLGGPCEGLEHVVESICGPGGRVTGERE